MPRPHRHPPRGLLDAPRTLHPRQPVRLLASAVVDVPEPELREAAWVIPQEVDVDRAKDEVPELVAALGDGHVGELGELVGVGSSDDDFGWAEAVYETIPEVAAREDDHRSACSVEDV